MNNEGEKRSGDDKREENRQRRKRGREKMESIGQNLRKFHNSYIIPGASPERSTSPPTTGLETQAYHHFLG